jgi:hypothetical protein
MANLEFSRRDIEGLTEKVASLYGTLSPQELALLLAIFAAAAGITNPPSQNQPSTLPTASSSGPPLAAGANYDATRAYFQQQLLNAYTPGNSFDSVTAGGDTGKII